MSVYSLQAFLPTLGTPLNVQAGLQVLPRRRIMLSYRLGDPNQQVEWPQPGAAPFRTDHLWEDTCLEAFLQPEGMSGYTELNLTPRLFWNAYHFDRYRQPDQVPPLHEPRAHLEKFESHHHRVEAVFDLSELYAYSHPIRFGLSAVLRLKDGNLDYWAMQHSGVQADFHNSIDWLGQFKLMP